MLDRIERLKKEIQDIAWVYDKLAGHWQKLADCRLEEIKAELDTLQTTLEETLYQVQWTHHRAKIVNNPDQDEELGLVELFQ